MTKRLQSLLVSCSLPACLPVGNVYERVLCSQEEEDAECLSVDCKAYPDMQGGEKEKSEVGPICDLKFDKPNNGCPIVVENTNQPRQMLVEVRPLNLVLNYVEHVF